MSVLVGVEKANVDDVKAQELVEHPENTKIPINGPIEVPLRKSQKERRLVFSND